MKTDENRYNLVKEYIFYIFVGSRLVTTQQGQVKRTYSQDCFCEANPVSESTGRT